MGGSGETFEGSKQPCGYTSRGSSNQRRREIDMLDQEVGGNVFSGIGSQYVGQKLKESGGRVPFGGINHA